MNYPDSTQHQVQRAEELVCWTGRERLRFPWYRLRLTISETNYASRRMVELQLALPAKRPTAPQPRRTKPDPWFPPVVDGAVSLPDPAASGPPHADPVHGSRRGRYPIWSPSRTSCGRR
jgi:hypothetical protein